MFKDKEGTAGGVTAVQFKTGEQGKSKVQLKAKGVRFVPAEPAGAEYFAQDPEVVTQLSRADGSTCWSSTLTSAKKNTAEQFKATAP